MAALIWGDCCSPILAYPELNTEMGETIVRDILAREMGRLGNMPVAEANAELAGLANRTIRRLSRQEQRDKEYACIVGGPGHENEPMRPPSMDDEMMTLGDTIKARRAAREQARQGLRYGHHKSDEA